VPSPSLEGGGWAAKRAKGVEIAALGIIGVEVMVVLLFVEVFDTDEFACAVVSVASTPTDAASLISSAPGASTASSGAAGVSIMLGLEEHERVSFLVQPIN